MSLAVIIIAGGIQLPMRMACKQNGLTMLRQHRLELLILCYAEPLLRFQGACHRVSQWLVQKDEYRPIRRSIFAQLLIQPG
ncbi:hypothetical protein D3C80_1714310 [compost metagenome]